MAEPRCTVLLPTHDHGDLIAFALRSLQRQTLADFEALVVGDGITDRGRAAVREFAAADARFRLFDLPKGPRHGELHRHAVLTEHARGRCVVYLCDDDLLLPQALAALCHALDDHDFVHPLPVYVDATGALGVASGHLRYDAVVQRLCAGTDYNFIALSGAAHTLAFYRALPFGWRTTPSGVPTDLYMWQQMLTSRGCRRRMVARPLALHFPSPDRRHWPTARRQAELARWEAIAAAPDGELQVAELALDHLAEAQWARDERLRQLAPAPPPTPR
jgi:glycosyltransferase involved in cell wall biosynthesis